MSRYRQTMSEALKQVRGIKEQDDKDHEISMARGELQAIADKATQLSSALQGKSDEGNPLEAWVQSKITKAKDYINSVSDYLMYNPDMKQNEEVNETPQGYALVQKAKEIAKKFANNLSKAVAEIEKLEKGLSKNSSVKDALQKANESLEEKFTVQITKKDGTTMELGRYNTAAEAQRFVDMYGKGAKVKKEEFELEEASLKDIFTANQEGQKADEIAKKLKMSIADVKKILGEEIGEISEESLDEFTSDMIKRLKKSYSTMPKTISPEQATALSKHLDRLDLTSLKQLAKEKIPFVTTLARNKIYKKTGKFEEVELEEKKLTVKKGDKVREINDFEWRTYSQMGYKLVGKDGQSMKEDKYAGARSIVETIQAVKNKAEKTGMPYSILKQVYDRGMAAWKGGHRPGATQQQWALARVNSFVTKSSGTWGGADKDLADKVRGSKK